MRVAALYDIHGNLPALDAVLDDVRQAEVDQIVVGGDVFPGPIPRETVARLLDLDVPARFILGNGDREVLSRMRGAENGALPEPVREVIRWVAESLRPEDERLIGGWPSTIHIDVDGLGRVLFCHATPRNDTEVFTRRTSEELLSPIFGSLDAQLVVCGHTHMPFDRRIGEVRVVNAGSVGMSFAGPGAFWLLLGSGVELRRTDYDLAMAAERIRSTSYPQAQDFPANNVLQPPSQATTLDLLARVELK